MWYWRLYHLLGLEFLVIGNTLHLSVWNSMCQVVLRCRAYLGHIVVSDYLGHVIVSDYLGHVVVSDYLGHVVVSDYLDWMLYLTT